VLMKMLSLACASASWRLVVASLTRGQWAAPSGAIDGVGGTIAGVVTTVGVGLR
jgi:hypothetical protein